MEASALPGLQFFVYMQPSEAFLVVGHTLSTIYSTTTDIANYHGKVVLFTGDRTATHKCVPVVLPPLCAFLWKKCQVVDNRSKLAKWYADNPAEYGNLWDPAVPTTSMCRRYGQSHMWLVCTLFLPYPYDVNRLILYGRYQGPLASGHCLVGLRPAMLSEK